jgi:quercetin dioxygenase-like cupin family protein
MTETEFEAELRRDGFEIAAGTLKPNEHRGEHAHDYDVRGLVVDGEFALTCDGRRRDYRAGDVFTMPAGRPHIEQAGPVGIRYIVGRRH